MALNFQRTATECNCSRILSGSDRGCGRRHVGPVVTGRLAQTRSDHLKENSHAPPTVKDQSPPRRVTNPGPRPSDPIWRTLTANQRQVLLHALSRLLVRRLPAAPDGKEVRDERN